jgi:hypothetical protein
MATSNPNPVPAPVTSAPVANNRYEFRQLDSTKGVAQGGDHIGMCGALLENRMQCTHSASYEVKDLSTPDKPAYQLCRKHMYIYEAEGLNWVNPVGQAAPAPKPLTPNQLGPNPTPAPASTTGKLVGGKPA